MYLLASIIDDPIILIYLKFDYFYSNTKIFEVASLVPVACLYPDSRNIIYRNTSNLIYDILNYLQILWKIVLIFMLYCSFLLLLFLEKISCSLAD
jgi:hypothetical protein